jgi:Glycosyltransferase Family 4
MPENDELSAPIQSRSASARVGGPAVLQIVPALDEDGWERGTIDLARHLVGRGWRALVASQGGPGESELESFGAGSLRLPVGSTNPFTSRANARRLQRLIREQDMNLVHVLSRASAWSAYRAARRCDVPFVTTIPASTKGPAAFSHAATMT